MIKAYLKANKTLPNGNKIEKSEVCGYLNSVLYREIIENNTTDIHFDYILLNIGGIEYDLDNCEEVILIKDDKRKMILSYFGGILKCDGIVIEPKELVKKLNDEIF